MKKAVYVSCFGWYSTRIKPIVELLGNDYEAIVLLSDFDHINKRYIKSKNSECEYIHVIHYSKNLSVKRIWSHKMFADRVYKYLEKEKPNFIYVLLPPNFLTVACAKYKRKNKDTFLVFDLIDMWPESMPMKKYHNLLPFNYWRNLRDKNLSSADHIFTECDLYREKLNSNLQSDISTLHLFKDVKKENLERIKTILSNRKKDANAITLGYLGSINNIIDITGIETIVRALSKKYSIKMNIIGAGEKKDEFIERMQNTGVNVQYYGIIFDDFRKLEILSPCDFALNMMVSSVSVGLTLKSIDYLSYGLPLINNIKGDTWNLVEREKIGINVSTDLNKTIKQIEEALNADHIRVIDCFNRYFTRDVFIENVRNGIRNYWK